MIARRRGRTLASTMVAALLSLVLLSAVEVTAADARTLDSYCSPSGDYCTSVKRSAAGRYVLGIGTFSFRGRYNLCVAKPGTGLRRCRTFRLNEREGLFQSNVNFFRAFEPPEEGRYCVAWRKFGSRLGPALCFPYRR